MKILITGSNSFVGTNFRKYSVYRDVDEISLFDYEPGKIDFHGYDIILHLVAIVHQRFTIPESEYFKINCDLTLNVAREAKKAGVKHFIFMSTVKVFGNYTVESGSWNETSPCLPADSYGRSKYAAEKGLAEIGNESFTVSIIRTPLVYGAGVKANMMVMVKLIQSLKILPFKGIRNRRNFTSAENLIAFIDRIIEKRLPGVFIAMDANAISTTELVKMISRDLDKKPVLFSIPSHLLMTFKFLFPRYYERLYGTYELDNSKTLSLLDFKPPLSTEEGIRRMIESFRTRK